MSSCWLDHLDALEEWLRRTREVVEGRADDAPPPPVAPAGPLPAALRVRAAVALAAVGRLEALGAQRRNGLARSQAYRRY